ncbi:WbqC family protein [Rhodospirillales bacterium]|nr:WbqC family protein [Rhodospirillales bacterium]
MILTAHQPVYLPWLGLFHKIALSDLFISFNQVQYQDEDWNNRNKILTPEGPLWLTVPALNKGRLDRKFTDIEISNTLPWRRKHWNTLRMNYGKTPYFSQYADYFEDIYRRDWNTLAELNESMLSWFLEILGIETPIRRADEFDFKGSKGDLVLDMCIQMNADAFIFGAQGEKYADLNAFEKRHIYVVFQEYNHPVYPQLDDRFVSHLSIVDLLFRCGDSSLDIIMSENLGREEIMSAIGVRG